MTIEIGGARIKGRIILDVMVVAKEMREVAAGIDDLLLAKDCYTILEKLRTEMPKHFRGFIEVFVLFEEFAERFGKTLKGGDDGEIPPEA